ncbi:hypothetical protein FOXYSP1_19288 [Fusarium oxysporum f. sp. phaseoli]
MRGCTRFPRTHDTLRVIGVVNRKKPLASTFRARSTTNVYDLQTCLSETGMAQHWHLKNRVALLLLFGPVGEL